ncbi:MAG: hypothetical protein ACLFVU_04005 [Phycisphaerae bacterium]
MSIDFSSLADDFFINLNVQTTLTLPDSRETILHFCEVIQKQFPEMTQFYQRESGDFVLEADRDKGSYRWMEIQSNRLTAGFFNPPTAEDAYDFHRWLLDRSVYFLGIASIDIEALDVLYGFNLDYRGNRDAIVARALYGGSPLGGLIEDGGCKPIQCDPTLVIGLDEECYMQARINLETRCSSYQVRTGNFDEEPISVYLTVRTYPRPGRLLNMQDSFIDQSEQGEQMLTRHVIPQVIRPIASAIAAS